MSIDLPLAPTRRNISNSEVTTFLTCRQMYDFAFVRNLAPKKTAKALDRGTLGHLSFQYYIEARLNGANHEQALAASIRAFNEAAAAGVSVEIVLETRYLVERYHAFHNGWPEWNLLGTEEYAELPITDEIVLPIRYDLYVEEIETGRKLIGDFKFTFRFWASVEHSLNGQMPKYITVMQKNGFQVDGGFLEQIRTEKLGKEKASDHRNLWKRTSYYPRGITRRNMLRQHVATSLEIMEYRALPDAEREAKTIPVLNKHGACKYCNFKELCASKLQGADIDHFIKTDFVQNSYAEGYNPTVEVEPTSLGDLI